MSSVIHDFALKKNPPPVWNCMQIKIIIKFILILHVPDSVRAFSKTSRRMSINEQEALPEFLLWKGWLSIRRGHSDTGSLLVCHTDWTDCFSPYIMIALVCLICSCKWCNPHSKSGNKKSDYTTNLHMLTFMFKAIAKLFLISSLLV